MKKIALTTIWNKIKYKETSIISVHIYFNVLCFMSSVFPLVSA